MLVNASLTDRHLAVFIHVMPGLMLLLPLGIPFLNKSKIILEKKRYMQTMLVLVCFLRVAMIQFYNQRVSRADPARSQAITEERQGRSSRKEA